MLPQTGQCQRAYCGRGYRDGAIAHSRHGRWRAEQVEAVANVLDGRPLDVLINNAGIADGAGHGAYEKDDPDIRNYDFDLWAELLRINTIAPTRVAGAFLDNIKVGDQEKIVNISSVSAQSQICPGPESTDIVLPRPRSTWQRVLSEWLKPQGNHCPDCARLDTHGNGGAQCYEQH